MRIVHGMSDANNTPPPQKTPPQVEILHSVVFTSDATDQLDAALSVAQGCFLPAQQGGTNPHFNKSYSNIADIWDVARAPISANGLSVMQLPTNKPGVESVTLVTRLGHKSGQWLRFELTFKATTSNPQNVGSVITYMKRYCLSGLLGIVSREDDDDGETGAGRGQNAGGNTSAPQNQAPAQKKAAPPATGAPANTPSTPAAPPIPDAAAGFCKRFADVKTEPDFRELVKSTRETFDDGTPEKKALSWAIKEAAKRLGIQSTKAPTTPAPTSTTPAPGAAT